MDRWRLFAKRVLRVEGSPQGISDMDMARCMRLAETDGFNFQATMYPDTVVEATQMGPRPITIDDITLTEEAAQATIDRWRERRKGFLQDMESVHQSYHRADEPPSLRHRRVPRIRLGRSVSLDDLRARSRELGAAKDSYLPEHEPEAELFRLVAEVKQLEYNIKVYSDNVRESLLGNRDSSLYVKQVRLLRRSWETLASKLQRLEVLEERFGRTFRRFGSYTLRYSSILSSL